jgi:ABC-2 type transport system permease protein
MKSIYIARKDLTRSFRSLFLLAFMFFIPLLVTGMFSLMFGGTAAAAQPARTRLVIADLDQGSSLFVQQMASFQGPAASPTLGKLLVQALQAENLAGVLEVSLAADGQAARQAVLNQQAAVAVLIPADFSAAYMDPHSKARLELYSDPAKPGAAAVAQAVIAPILEPFSGLKIALGVIAAGQPDAAGMDRAAQETLAWSAASAQNPASLLDLRSPASAPPAAAPLAGMLGPIMAGMLIFFAFFTAASTAQTLLTEQEDGTLARLFTTPTPVSTILGGKFLAVGLTVLVQVTVMLGASAVLFNIQWGAPGPVLLAAGGIVACATSFGIFLNSLLKNARQGGVVFGGFLTVTGMIAMLGIFSGPGAGETVALLVPQGWALRGLLIGLNGEAAGPAALNLLAVLAWSAAFAAAGLLRFQKRFAS